MTLKSESLLTGRSESLEDPTELCFKSSAGVRGRLLFLSCIFFLFALRFFFLSGSDTESACNGRWSPTVDTESLSVAKLYTLSISVYRPSESRDVLTEALSMAVCFFRIELQGKSSRLFSMVMCYWITHAYILVLFYA